MFEVPPGFRYHTPIIQRFGGHRRDGYGIKFRCLFPQRHKNGDANWSCFAYIGDNGSLVARCLGCGATWEELVREVGLPAVAWGPPGLAERMGKVDDGPKYRPVAEYPYHDRDGRLVAVKTRFERTHADGRREKYFGWKRPLPDRFRAKAGLQPRQPAWVKDLKAGWYSKDRETGGAVYFGPTVSRIDGEAFEVLEAVPGLYRLPDLLRADAKRLVFVVEGEKCADRLAGLGFVAVSGPHGSSRWPWEESGWLADRRVVVMPDDDEKGVELMMSAVASLIPFRAAGVRWCDVPNPEAVRGWDVDDWLAGVPDVEAVRRVKELVAGSNEVAVGAVRPANKAA